MQPKLDGIRCIAIVKDGKCTLWSRTRKPINSVPHIIQAIEAQVKGDIILDGELYNHLFKNDFEKIVSAVRKDEPSPESFLVQYHIYDVINDEPMSKRINTLHESVKVKAPLFPMQTVIVEEGSDLAYFFLMRKHGYEGAMIRNMNATYVPKRSMDLQKLKEFHEKEFKIVDVEEGSGKLQGHVGSFVCITEEGVEFNAKLDGDTGYLKECFERPYMWKNKLLTVVYQGFGIERRPRFPVGKAIRDYE
jgi:DNA ligase-1